MGKINHNPANAFDRFTEDTNRRLRDLERASTVVMGELIAHQALLIDTDEVVFDDIPQAFKHLKLVANVRSNGVAVAVNITINDVVTGSYFSQLAQVNNATFTGLEGIGATSARVGAMGGLADRSNSLEILFPDYTDALSDPHWQSFAGRSDTDATGGQYVEHNAGFLNSPGAITKIDLLSFGAPDFDQTSEFTLYGLNV